MERVYSINVHHSTQADKKIAKFWHAEHDNVWAAKIDNRVAATSKHIKKLITKILKMGVTSITCEDLALKEEVKALVKEIRPTIPREEMMPKVAIKGDYKRRVGD